jgi:hypothetical protein
MKAIKILTMFPIMCAGYVIGFLYQSIAVGIYAGKCAVEAVAETCAKDLDAKKSNDEAHRRLSKFTDEK